MESQADTLQYLTNIKLQLSAAVDRLDLVVEAVIQLVSESTMMRVQVKNLNAVLATKIAPVGDDIGLAIDEITTIAGTIDFISTKLAVDLKIELPTTPATETVINI